MCQAIEEGVCHMWTVSAFQQHPNTMIIVDEVLYFSWYYYSSFERLSCFKLNFSCTKDATLELRVRTVKYFKDMWQVS